MRGIEDDDKARYVLEEHKLTRNLPRIPTNLTLPFTIPMFKKLFMAVVVRLDENEIEFDLLGIHPFIANTFRRLMLESVPTMAIEKVCILKNTSIITDDVLAHRLGLVPLKADPTLFEYKNDGENNEKNTLEFELVIKCTHNKDGKHSSCTEDMYKNSSVYSKNIKWLPIGNQKDKFTEKDVGPIHDDILIAKLRPGHEIDLKMVAVKGTGAEHAKFSPVAAAYYRMMPEIFLTREFEGEAAERLQKSFTPGVIELREENGKQIAVVKNARYDMSTRNVYKHDDLADGVVMTKVHNHFIFNVESIGAIKPEVVFTEAVRVLKNKCIKLLDELNNSQR